MLSEETAVGFLYIPSLAAQRLGEIRGRGREKYLCRGFLGLAKSKRRDAIGPGWVHHPGSPPIGFVLMFTIQSRLGTALKEPWYRSRAEPTRSDGNDCLRNDP